jgi:hypothetical protein
MGNKKINILKDLLNDVPRLLKLSYRDNEHNKWNARVVSTLETLFGKNSRQYYQFATKIRSYKQYATAKERRQEYLRDVRLDKNALEAIIAGLEQEEKVKDAFKFERTLKAILNWVYSKPKVVWQWIKDHKIPSIIGAVLIIGVTLLGTNWDTVVSNWSKCISFIRSIF